MITGLLKKYNEPTQEEPIYGVQESPTQEEVKEKLDNASIQEEKEIPTQVKEKLDSVDNAGTGPTMFETVRNLGADIGAGILAGKIGAGIKSKVSSLKPAKAAAKEAIESLKNGVDDALGHMSSLIKKSNSNESLLKKLMNQNKKAAKSVAEGGNGKKALKTVVKNTMREAEIGPLVMDDISEILKNNTGLSENKVKKAIKDFIKENADNVDLLTLIEAKEPIATYGHSLGVQDLAYKLAKKAGLDDIAARKISEAALVHDIGKIQVPDSVISSKDSFSEQPHLRDWMDGHDIAGEDILKSDTLKAKVARGHHPRMKRSDGSLEEGLVTVADMYEAMTSSKRSYKDGMPREEALGKIRDNVMHGDIDKQYYDFIMALYKDGLLPESYNYTSPLEDVYKSMKANGIIKQVGADYNKEFFNRALKKDLPIGMGAGAIGGGILGLEALGARYSDDEYPDGYKPFKADKGGVLPASLPSPSEIIPQLIPKGEKLEEIRSMYDKGVHNDIIDTFISNTDFKNNTHVSALWTIMKIYESGMLKKQDKIDDIRRWYNNGITNDEIDRLIFNTDFKDDKQVNKLWKLMNEQFKDEE